MRLLAISDWFASGLAFIRLFNYFLDDFRLFCGDLGNDVTDDLLKWTFSKYSSFIKAKVIRDKRTNKSKGYGFVSFKNAQDYINAMKEINGLSLSLSHTHTHIY